MMFEIVTYAHIALGTHPEQHRTTISHPVIGHFFCLTMLLVEKDSQNVYIYTIILLLFVS
jgi:hypothetical protein